jgi:predicted transcriptional regulator of viral defense system
MNFEKIVDRYSDRPFFELREVLASSDDSPKSLKNQLSDWVRNGKLTRLRRGKYLLEEPYRNQFPSVYFISNCLLRPSYVSLQTALQFHGLIPEAVAQIQAVTPKHGKKWGTDLGTFKYFSMKQDRFWGYKQYASSSDNRTQNLFYMARPEKALLDLFYLEEGDWPAERIQEMRFQKLEKIEKNKLEDFTDRFDSPKVRRASNNFQSLHLESPE